MGNIIIASSNAGKLAEFQALLSPNVCIPQHTLGIDSPDETGLSFIENAIIKARHASRISQQPALADDSGLVVPALGGAPGVYSARFAGVNATDEENIEKLLSELEKKTYANRYAFFYCAIAFVENANSPTPFIATGRLPGEIANEPYGTNGFGYDPIFYLPTHHCTLAELSSELKNTLSHRAEAINAFKSLRVQSQ